MTQIAQRDAWFKDLEKVPVVPRDTRSGEALSQYRINKILRESPERDNLTYHSKAVQIAARALADFKRSKGTCSLTLRILEMNLRVARQYREDAAQMYHDLREHLDPGYLYRKVPEPTLTEE